MMSDWKNRSSLKGTILKKSLCNLDYDSPQTLKIEIIQKNRIIFQAHITDIVSTGKFFDFEYQFLSLEENIMIVFSNYQFDMQFNLDNSIEIQDLMFDELFCIPRITQSATMKNQNTTIFNTNSLFGTGTLTYELPLPIFRAVLTVE